MISSGAPKEMMQRLNDLMKPGAPLHRGNPKKQLESNIAQVHGHEGGVNSADASHILPIDVLVVPA